MAIRIVAAQRARRGGWLLYYLALYLIEQEARKVLVKAREEARKTIADHRSALDGLVAELLAHETIDRHDLARILGPSADARAAADEKPASPTGPVDS